VVHSFTGGIDGSTPYSGVILDSAGNLYGTTSAGGASYSGVVYKIDTTGNQTVLYSFTIGADGTSPFAGVILDSSGNLFGTTYAGGTANAGVVYKLDPLGNETVLYSFTGETDGANPSAGVVEDPAGNLYGTAAFGGAAGAGVVYEVDAAGSYTVLYSFSGGAAGANPYAGVILDPAGNLYGTTYLGGPGAVYKLDTAGDLTVLHSFTGGAGGENPYASLILGPAGSLYGTTYTGGTAEAGLVYKLDAAGDFTVLHSFPATDGYGPSSAVTGDPADLYGTAPGGAAGAGVVYMLDATGHETRLYTFTGGADGNTPYGGVIRGEGGSLYGTTVSGGTSNAGVVYKLDSTGHLTVLHSFTGGADGGYPRTGVIRDSAGNLYGSTYGGGASDFGVVYKLDTTRNFTVLYSFAGGADGAYPGALVLDPAGNLYGAASGGGAAGEGVVFELDTAGSLTVLHSFTGGADGGNPDSVIRDPAGNLYGTASGGGAHNGGEVFKLDTADHLTVLHRFGTDSDGSSPVGSLIRDSAGNLFGATSSGGASGWGTVYELDPKGFDTILYAFTNGDDGGLPSAGVIRDPEGNLYGTTSLGGTRNGGVVFKLTGVAPAE
jgi:uncharacterized repeat protein (TIGR03803 family)